MPWGDSSRVREMGCVGGRSEVSMRGREGLPEKVTFESRLERGEVSRPKPQAELPSRSSPAQSKSRPAHRQP